MNDVTYISCYNGTKRSREAHLTELHDFIQANREFDGIDDASDLIRQVSWIFLSRWQRIRVAWAIFRQAWK